MTLKRLLIRIASMIALVLLIFIGTRLLVRALPGDPVETMIAESGTTIPAETLRAELNLDQPLLESLLADFRKASHGDLGVSLLSRRPIAPLLGLRALKTLRLAILAIFLSLCVSVPLGVAAASRPGGRLDGLCTAYGALMAALPSPWTGPILLVIFALWLPVFPVSGGILLPAITLALSFSGLWARLVRERVRESLLVGAANGARARGLPEWRVLWKYGLMPVSGSLVAYLGTQFGALLAGSVVIEVIFDWKGMGSLLVEGVLRRDYPIVEATTFVAASFCLLGNALGDWGRLRLGSIPMSSQAPRWLAGGWLAGWLTASILLRAGSFEFVLEHRLERALQPPSWPHPLGCDTFGRDLAWMMLSASGTSTLLAAFTAVLTCALAAGLGGALALAPPGVRYAGSRALESLLAFPSLLIALAWAAIRGPAWDTLLVALLIGSLPGFTRLVHVRALEILNEDYVLAARGLGAGAARVFRRHLAPALLSLCTVKFPTLFAGALMAEATLSFLGVGAPIGRDTWGSLLAQGKDYLFESPHIAVAVGTPLVLTVLSLQIFTESPQQARH